MDGKSIDEIASILVFFPNFKRPKIILRFLFIYSYYFVAITDGFLLKFIDTQLLPMPRVSLGPLTYAIHLMYGSVFADLMYNRSCLVYQHLRYGKDNLKWYKLVKDASKEEYPLLFKISHFLFAELYATCTQFFILE